MTGLQYFCFLFFSIIFSKTLQFVKYPWGWLEVFSCRKVQQREVCYSFSVTPAQSPVLIYCNIAGDKDVLSCETVPEPHIGQMTPCLACVDNSQAGGMWPAEMAAAHVVDDGCEGWAGCFSPPRGRSSGEPVPIATLCSDPNLSLWIREGDWACTDWTFCWGGARVQVTI